MLLLVSAAGATLLITLAVLQYRWLSQLSEADALRMRRHLHGAAIQLTRDLDSEIARVQMQIQFGRLWYQQDIEGEFAERYANWANNNPSRALVSAVYLVSRDGEQFHLRRLNLESGKFADAAWPANLAALVERLRERERPGEPPGPPGPAGVEADPLILISPHFAARMPRFGERREMGPPGPRGPRVFSIIVVDGDYVSRTLVPALVRKHLSREGTLDYHVQVADNAAAAPLYDSEVSNPTAFIAQPDVSVPLLASRQGPFFRRDGNGFRRDGNGFGRPNGPPTPRGEPEEGGWRLLIVHRSGSLDVVVGEIRNRNLAVGFGVLALLAGAIAVLLIALRRAQLLAQLQLEFVAGVSHELRTPLSVIRSAGENLADGVTTGPDAVRRYGALVRDEGRRLSEMVEQILTFARTHAAFERHPAQVGELVERAIAACSHELQGSGCELSKDLDPALPAVDADATALVHALRNLVSNAATHGGRGEPIRVSARHNNGAVEIEVADNGPGIDPKDLDHIFDPFYRGHRARENQTRGLGLGLSLVKRIVEAHGGSVTAANNPGRGANFTVRLPASKPVTA